MDSINKNQSEENKENLIHAEAMKKIKEIIDKSPSCFFNTNVEKGPSNGVRPMSVQKVDEEGNLWFLSAADSYKNKEISVDPKVELYFQGSPHSDFLYLSGKAVISKNKEKIDELWQPLLKTWYYRSTRRSSDYGNKDQAVKGILLGYSRIYHD